MAEELQPTKVAKIRETTSETSIDTLEHTELQIVSIKQSELIKTTEKGHNLPQQELQSQVIQESEEPQPPKVQEIPETVQTVFALFGDGYALCVYSLNRSMVSGV